MWLPDQKTRKPDFLQEIFANHVQNDKMKPQAKTENPKIYGQKYPNIEQDKSEYLIYRFRHILSLIRPFLALIRPFLALIRHFLALIRHFLPLIRPSCFRPNVIFGLFIFGQTL